MGFALWIPTTFEKVDETLSVWVLLLLFGLSGFCYAATAAACYPTIYGKFNAAAPQKNKKLTDNAMLIFPHSLYSRA